MKDHIKGQSAYRGELENGLMPTRYSIRLLRYWWAGQALAAEARRQGRKLTVLDLGCERGWLKLFTPEGCVERWIGLDWNPRSKEDIGYHEVIAANFDEPLPLETHSVDAVVSLHVFEHLPRPGATVAEVSRILKYEGIFLAGTPTIPEPFAKLRERYFRHEFRQGRIIPGGHINSFSPRRWRGLLYEVGLSVEFLTGSHAIRWSGSFLENSKLWVRLNQLWGAVFPSLGSECCVQARLPAPTHLGAVPLTRRRKLSRLVWMPLGAVAAIALVASLVGAFNWAQEKVDRDLEQWVQSNQDGNNRFYVWHEWAGSRLRSRSDVHIIQAPSDLAMNVFGGENVYILLSKETSQQFLSHEVARTMTIHSHLKVGERDFYVINLGLKNRTQLADFI